MAELPWSREDSGMLRLIYKACLNCGRETFPPQTYGCLECGTYAEGEFVDSAIGAVGKLVAQVEVQVHPEHPTPYWIGEIAVAGTSLHVEAPLVGGPLRPGEDVVGVLVDEQGFGFTAAGEFQS